MSELDVCEAPRFVELMCEQTMCLRTAEGIIDADSILYELWEWWNGRQKMNDIHLILLTDSRTEYVCSMSKSMCATKPFSTVFLSPSLRFPPLDPSRNYTSHSAEKEFLKFQRDVQLKQFGWRWCVCLLFARRLGQGILMESAESDVRRLRRKWCCAVVK